MMKVLLLLLVLAPLQQRNLSEFNERRLDEFEEDLGNLQDRHLNNDPVTASRIATVEGRSETNEGRVSRLEWILLSAGGGGAIGGEYIRRRYKKKNGKPPKK